MDILKYGKYISIVVKIVELAKKIEREKPADFELKFDVGNKKIKLTGTLEVD